MSILVPDTEADRYEVEELLPWRMSFDQYTTRVTESGAIQIRTLRLAPLARCQREVPLPGQWEGKRS